MLNKKILLVGDSRSPFIENLKKNLEWKFQDYTVDIYDMQESAIVRYGDITSAKEFNREQKLSLIQKIKRKMKLFIDFYFLSKKYDVVNFHYFIPTYFYLIKKFHFKKIILTIWGSDFNCRTMNSEEKLRKTIGLVSRCNCTNVTFKNNIVNTLNINHNLIDVVSFGLEPLNFINMEWDKNELRSLFNLSKNKKIVVIGYNGSIRQNHISILESIRLNLDICKLQEIEIVVPIAYGVSEEYNNELNKYIKKFPSKVILFKHFMSNIDMAKFRYCADIMINLQQTDQLSGSMQEYIYSKCVIITGSWLPYQALLEAGAHYHAINEISQCGFVLNNVLNDFNAEQSKCNKNPAIIWNMSSWESNIHKWQELYS